MDLRALSQLKTLIICITGDLGSGKSVVRKKLENILKLPAYSTGDFQRQLAISKSMTTLEFNKFAETHPEIDFEIDELSTKLGQNESHFIIDSRLAWHFIPKSFKIYLSVKTEIAGKRIFYDSNRKDEQYESIKDTIAAVRNRKKSEKNRYLNLYQIVLDNFENYDLVINTSFKNINSVVTIILDSLINWAEGKPFPNRLFF